MTTPQVQVQADETALTAAANALQSAATLANTMHGVKGVPKAVLTDLAKQESALIAAETSTKTAASSAGSWLAANPIPIPAPAPAPVPTPAPTPNPTPVSSGLVIAGNSKANALQLVSVGSIAPTPSSLYTLPAISGVTLQSPVVSINARGAQTWAFDDWEGPWPEGQDSTFGWVSWMKGSPGPRQLILSIQLVPTAITTASPAGSASPWYAQGAAGDYNAYATAFGQNLVAAGMGNSVLRIAAEMNDIGGGNNDVLPSDTPSQLIWAKCFAQMAGAIKAAAPDVLICFDVNAWVNPIPFADYYPGNDVVDIIGIDFYDVFADPSGKPPVGSTERFAALAADPYSLDAITTFAVAQGKPLALPEWGLTSDGDDPLYVEGIAAWTKANNVAFQCYFNSGDSGISALGSSSIPLSTAAYIAAFG